jgi:hypothetical protein
MALFALKIRMSKQNPKRTRNRSGSDSRNFRIAAGFPASKLQATEGGAPMSWKEIAPKLALAGNLMLAASLFLVLIWWRYSLYLFVGGAAVYLVLWLMDETAPAAAAVTAPE